MKPTYSVLRRKLAARRNSDTNKPSKSCSRRLTRWKTGGRRLWLWLLRSPACCRHSELWVLQACVLSMGPKPLAQFQTAPPTSLSISLTRVTFEHAGQSNSASPQMPQYPSCRWMLNWRTPQPEQRLKALQQTTSGQAAAGGGGARVFGGLTRRCGKTVV